MKRDTVINVLLIVAGIMLAIALFGAGVLWKRGAATSPKSLLSAPSLSQGESENWIGRHTVNAGMRSSMSSGRMGHGSLCG